MKCLLAIAGSDSCAGAGIQADIKTAYKLNYHAVTVISALTAQNSVDVLDIMAVPQDFIYKQLKAILDDIVPDATKIGMLFSSEAIEIVSEVLLKNRLPCIVLDPLVRSSTGKMLLDENGICKLKKRLFPVVDLITPNVYEAEILTETKIKNLKDMEKASIILYEAGAKNVIITGYHKRGKIIDMVFDGRDFFYIKDTLLPSQHNHGSGCVYSSSIAIYMSQGHPLKKAATFAHDFTKEAIMHGYPMGKGSGSVFP